MSSKRFAVIGDPIEHSRSPRMQMAAFRAAGIQATYEPLHVTATELADAVRRLRDGGYIGFNVTIPHKRAMPALLDSMDPIARQTGAVNTVVREGTELIGYNTDVEGFDMALTVLAGPDWRGRCLLFGAGGAARAVVAALQRRGCEVTVTNRSVESADALAKEIGGEVKILRRLGDLEAAVYSADLVVNATALGMGDLSAVSPLPPGAHFRPGALAIDLVYGRQTPFLIAAIAAGCRVQDGIEMLVQQGAAAFRLWTGIQPDTGVMREACLQPVTEVVS